MSAAADHVLTDRCALLCDRRSLLSRRHVKGRSGRHGCAPHRRQRKRRRGASDAARRRGRAGRHPGGADRACAPRWCSARSAVMAAIARLSAQFQIDRLWFEELGQERVFWTMLASRWLAGSLAAVVTTMVLLANFWIVERTAPAAVRLPRRQVANAGLRRMLLVAYLAVSTAAGVIVGRSVVIADWQQLLLWLHRRDFGVVDPLFHRDVGFFVFSLPLYQRVADWLFLTIAVALACAVVAHIATGAIRTKPAPISATRGAHAHLLVLGAVLLLVTGWKHWLEPVRPRAPSRGRHTARRRVHRRARSPPVAARARAGHARGRGDAAVRGPAALVVAPRPGTGDGRGRGARQPLGPALGRAAPHRGPADPVARAPLPRPLRQVHAAGLRARSGREPSDAGERQDLLSRAAGRTATSSGTSRCGTATSSSRRSISSSPSAPTTASAAPPSTATNRAARRGPWSSARASST